MTKANSVNSTGVRLIIKSQRQHIFTLVLKRVIFNMQYHF